MNILRVVTFGMALVAIAPSVGCARKAELKVNGRPSEYLEARVSKSGDAFKVEVTLPMGKWAASLKGDSSDVFISTEANRPTASWLVAPGRMNESRAFFLELRDPQSGEARMMMEIHPKYPGQGFVEGVLGVMSWFAR